MRLPSSSPLSSLLPSLTPSSPPIQYEQPTDIPPFRESHVSLPFSATFGEALAMLRALFQTKDPASQPFVIAGSGTLGWDVVAANLIEPGENALVLHTGYFGDSFADCLSTYGANPTQVKAAIGERPQPDEIEKALKEKKYKLVTVTHVDTSTGVLSDIKAVSEVIQRVSPETLLVVDGVCSIGAEDLKFDEWKVDVALTASQKAIGCPPGLSILMVSGKAMDVFKARKSRPTSYFASMANWLPIMKNYEAKKPSYFATPPTQLVHALHTALTQLLSGNLDERFEKHKEASQKVKKAIADLGLKQIATKPENQANAMTAMWLPEGLAPPDILPILLKKGVVFAGGLHKEIATKYIRFGHMGVSVMDPQRNDVDKGIEALREGFAEVEKKK